jgi:hypothetical protein
MLADVSFGSKADMQRTSRCPLSANSRRSRCRPVSLQVSKCWGRLNGASGRIIGLEACSPWQPFFFDRCPFWASKFLNNFIRPMTRLFYRAHPPFGRLPKECGCWPVAVPRAGTPAPTCAEGSDVGEPTGTAIDGHERQWWGRCWS